MADAETASQVSRFSIYLSLAFALVGVGLLYVAIGMVDAPMETKVLWASGLSLMVAFGFVIVWSMAREAVRTIEEDLRRKGSA
ncbi:MAG TPA: hypothetical protein VF374_09060 [Thermoplasmata archaeon]|jgi:flagellar biosynthesis protein FliR